MFQTKRLLIVIAILSLIIAKTDSIAQKKQNSTPYASLPAVVIVNAQHGDNIPNSIITKIDAAFSLALYASEKFRAIPYKERDSTLAIMRKDKPNITAGELAARLGAKQAAFIIVNRLNNILRVSLTCRYGDNFSELREGVGYAVLKYRKGSEDSILYDPSLLAAIQRAFALSQSDTLMYRRAEPDMRVFPVKLLAPTHLEFKQKVGTASQLFDILKQPVIAYDAMQTIFIAAKDHPLYAPLDVDTRDSIYAMANLYDVENSKPPNILELKVLYQLEIRNCLMAELTQDTKDDLLLDMKLCEILPDGNLRLTRKERTALSGDKIADLQNAIKKTVKKILRER